MIRVADYIMQFLLQQNINHIFTVSGRGILYLTDALAKCQEMQSVSVHHEQAAAYAAYSYAQCKGAMGACLVSTGCAGTNTMTGVLCSWQDSVPTIFISGQNVLKETTHYTKLNIRTYGQQEADIVSLVDPITKYAVMIEEPEKIAYELEKAVYMANEGRKGPVWIDVPLDIQNMRVDPEQLVHFSEEAKKVEPTDDDIQSILKELKKAERPVVLAGGGVRASGAQKMFAQWIEKNELPVVFTPSATDLYGAGERFSFGAVGSLGGSRVGNFVMQNADFLLVLGSQLSSMITGDQFEKFARNAKVYVVDIDEEQHKKAGVHIERVIYSDICALLEVLLKYDIGEKNGEWIEKCNHWKEIFPLCEKRHCDSERVDLYYLGESISKVMNSDAVVLSDAGFEELIIPATVSMRGEQRMIHPVAQGTMGFALPAAMGASVIDADRQVISVNGDGSIMMNLQELQTISHYQLPIKIIIANNNCYAVIRKRQEDLFRTRTIGTDQSNGVSCPNYEKVAYAFNIPYVKIENSVDLQEQLDNCLQEKGPMIIEVMCVEQQEYLHNSFTRGVSGKIVRRGLEDQSPFMERELFLKEMVIEPIDQ